MDAQKGAWLLAILGAIMIILLCILFFVPAKKTTQNPPVAVDGIEVISPKANEKVSSPIKIAGVVNGNGWAGFEGQVGTVMFIAKDIELGKGVLTTTSDWTRPPISFETVLNFSEIIGPTPVSGVLFFHNENPSGDPAKDKTFSLPVNINSGDIIQP